MLRQAVGRLQASGSLRAVALLTSESSQQATGYAHQATAIKNQFYDVPEGHQGSDLSNAACNISLTRRKDLAMRQDLRLTVQGKDQSLAELLRGHKAVLFGVPDRGAVCSEQQVPGYLREWDKLRAAGVSRILCVTVGTPAEAADWAAKLQLDTKIEVAADTNQGVTRFLGMELMPLGQPGPHSMRWAALVDDGILLKVRVEQSPGEFKATSAEALTELAKKCLSKP